MLKSTYGIYHERSYEHKQMSMGPTLARNLKPSPWAFMVLWAFMAEVTACPIAHADSEDPFSDLQVSPSASIQSQPAPQVEPWWSKDTLFRKEIFSQLSYSDTINSDNSLAERIYSRQSIGFELQRRFSTTSSTWASCDAQGRFVRRDHFLPVIDDMEGEDREGWQAEYHNLYCDLYNPIGWLLSDEAAGKLIGILNFRMGRFYLPLGLNLQTDTHGTVLQLSNEQNVGFERDWYAGVWGGIGWDLKYDLYYLVGSGYDLSFEGQSGLVGFRLSSSANVQNETGIEAGFAVLAGQRLRAHDSDGNSPTGNETASGHGDEQIIDTLRYGPDLRYTIPTAHGSVILTTELNGGRDDARETLMQLYQIGFLHKSRRVGSNVQHRQFWSSPNGAGSNDMSSIIFDLTYYLSNDLSNSNLHWVTINVEQILEGGRMRSGVITTLQYYRYW